LMSALPAQLNCQLLEDFVAEVCRIVGQILEGVCYHRTIGRRL
jgi:hypothetical protein